MNFQRITIGLIVLLVAGLAGSFYMNWKTLRQLQTISTGNVKNIQGIAPLGGDAGTDNLQFQLSQCAGNLISKAGFVYGLDFDQSRRSRGFIITNHPWQAAATRRNNC